MDNPMREIRIEKVVINIGCGEAGEKLDKAKKLLEGLLNGHKIVITHTHDRTTFGMAKGRPIGVKVTLRGKDAAEFLKRALESVDNRLPEKCFDRQGNLSFGVKEHISMPGVKYDPELGVWGMDVCIRLERRGYRVLRKNSHAKISSSHRVAPEEARAFMTENFGVKVGAE
jgi:large subunit ribosomal protein L5